MEISSSQIDKWRAQVVDARLALPSSEHLFASETPASSLNCTRTFLLELEKDLREKYLDAVREEARAL